MKNPEVLIRKYSDRRLYNTVSQPLREAKGHCAHGPRWH